MDQLSKKFPKIDSSIIDHVYNQICFSNSTMSEEILQNMSSNDIKQLLSSFQSQSQSQTQSLNKKNIVDECERVIEGVGLYDMTNNEKVLLQKIVYKVNINDYISSIECTQFYENRKNDIVEMIYQYPIIQENTVIWSIIIELIDDEKNEKKVLIAKVKGKDESKEMYDDQISRGRAAMLIEKNNGRKKNLVTLNLGNIKPKYKVNIKIKMLKELQLLSKEENHDDDDMIRDENERIMVMKCEIPSIFNLIEGEEEGQDVQMEKGLSGKARKLMNVTCKTSIEFGEIMEITSPSHNDVFKSVDEKVMSTTEPVSTSKDFVIQVKVKKYPMTSIVFQENEQKQGSEHNYTCMVNIVPQNQKGDKSTTVNSELIAIIDCSGSMSGSRMRDARGALKYFLQSLDPSDNIKINIVRFGTGITSLYHQPRLFNQDVLNEANYYVDQTSSNMGGTNIMNPIRNIMQQPISEGYSRQLWLITDGEDSNALQICNYVKPFAVHSRIFSIGIGREVNEFFIKEIARSCNGRYCFIKESKEINRKVLEQLNYAIQPSIKDITVKFDEEFGKVKKVINEIPNVYFNQNYAAYFFVEKFCEKEIEISFNQKKDKVNCNPKLLKETGTYIAIMAANKRINELQIYGTDKTKDKEEILELGLKYNLLTSETSMIISFENEEKVTGEMKVEKIPNIQYVEQTKYQSRNDNINNGNIFQSYGQFQSGGQERFRSLAPMRGNRYTGSSSIRESFESIEDGSVNLCRAAPQSKSSGCAGGGGGGGNSSGFEAPSMSMSSESNESFETSKRDVEEFDKRYKSINLKGSRNKQMKPKKDSEKFFDEFNTDEELFDSEPFEQPGTGTGTTMIKLKGEERKEKKTVNIKNKIDSIKGDTLDKILFTQSIDGLWPFDKEIAILLHIPFEDITNMNNINNNNDKEESSLIWITSIIIVILRNVYKNDNYKWQLIVKKAIKALKKRGKISLIKIAEDFVKKYNLY